MTTPRHSLHLAHQPPDPRTLGIRFPDPVAHDARVSEQHATDLTLTGSVDQRIMDTQQRDAALHPGIARKQRAPEPTVAVEMQQSSQPQNGSLCLAHSMQPIVKMDHRLTGQPPFRHVEPDVMAAVGKDGVVIPFPISHDGEPRSDSIQVEAIAIRAIDRNRGDAQRPGIKIGMPEKPRLRCRPGRIFRESVAPSGADRRYGRM